MTNKKEKQVDKKFLWVTLVLLFVGVVTFISSSLGIYTENKEMFNAMMLRHIGLGVIGGLLAMYIMSKIDFNIWKRFSIYIYILGLIITALVFIPGIGVNHGGASRWISLGLVAFQPAELLKFSVILFFASWFSKYQKGIKTIKKGVLIFLVALAIPLFILAKQPDFGSIALIGGVSFLLYLVRGAPWKHLAFVVITGLIFIGTYAAINPYIISRFETFSNSNIIANKNTF